MKFHSVMFLAAFAGSLCLIGSFSLEEAHACKYPCTSQAPTTLNQVTPPPSPPPPSGTPPTAQQYNQCFMHAKTAMTGTQLYAMMQTLPQIEQNAFFSVVQGSGGGQNDLQSQVQNQMFGGNMTAYNQWINDNFYSVPPYDQFIQFNVATGEITRHGVVIDTVAGWSCPYYP